MTTSLSAALFSYGPYFVLFGFLGAWMYRWGILRNDRGPKVAAISAPAEGALGIGFSILMAGHAATAIAPGAMRVLLSDSQRVAVIEAVGLVGAMLFAFGVAARLRARCAAMRSGVVLQESRVFVLLLLLAVSLSGIYLTITYRWITAWYAYISVPYVRSLAVLEPQTAAMVASPLAVKLHAGLFMLLVGAWPMAGLALEEIFPYRALARRIAADAEGAPRSEAVS